MATAMHRMNLATRKVSIAKFKNPLVLGGTMQLEGMIFARRTRRERSQEGFIPIPKEKRYILKRIIN